jgi:hypothetical protein
MVLATLAACGTERERPVQDFVKSVAEARKTKGKTPPTLEQQRAALVAQLKKSGSTQPVLLVELTQRGAVASLSVAGQNRGAQSWFDPTGVSVVTRRGVVVETRGLGHDLMSSNANGTLNALSGGGRGYKRFHRYLDGEGQPNDITFTCDASRSGNTVTETCAVPEGSFTNTYQLRGGSVVESRQWLGREIGYARITRLQ